MQAVATSLLAVALSASSGTLQNWRTRHLQFNHIVLLAPSALVATEFGVWAANALPARVLLLAFAALLLTAIWLMSLKSRLKE